MAEKKSKGFIFTVDSIAAMAIIIAIAAAWSISVRVRDSENYFSSMEKIARDQSLVNIYTHEPLSEDFNSAKPNTVCKRYFTLFPRLHTEPAELDRHLLCIDHTVVG